MRNNNDPKTIQRNYVRKWQHLIKEYDLVKQKRHPRFRFVTDLYKFHAVNRQTFLKYYHRFQQSGMEGDLLPRARGPKWKNGRTHTMIAQWVLGERKKGSNRYEIYAALLPKCKHLTPSPATIQRICARYGLGRLKPKMKQNKRMIIKTRAGEMAHVDTHHLGVCCAN